MKCPFCAYDESKVVDSRQVDDGDKIKRRRECLKCGKRFTTYEVVETTPIFVIKRNGTRERFDRIKLTNGLLHACEKRPVPRDILEKLVDEVEAFANNRAENEISSQEIGSTTLLKLKDIDQVAYVRFASVYRNFDDLRSFVEVLESLNEENNNN